jgi:excinuclease UvrABC helicase subunit UvrB
VKKHSPNEEYTLSHEQYRGFVLFHRTQAAAALAIEKDEPEAAIDAIHDGLERIRAFFEEHHLEERADEDGMVQQLKKIQQQIRELHGINATLKEQLAEAVANEQYEAAAKLRDALKRREK